MLSAPIIASTPSSDFRSALRHFTGCAYRLRRYRQPQGGKPWSRGFRCRDGSLLFRAGLCDRSAPITPTGLWCCIPRSTHRSWPSPWGSGLGTRMFPAHARVLHDADTGFLSYGPITCSPPQRRLCHGASTVRSPLPPATSYGAAWPLPRPDSHRQAQHSFQDTHPRRNYGSDHLATAESVIIVNMDLPLESHQVFAAAS